MKHINLACSCKKLRTKFILHHLEYYKSVTLQFNSTQLVFYDATLLSVNTNFSCGQSRLNQLVQFNTSVFSELNEFNQYIESLKLWTLQFKATRF